MDANGRTSQKQMNPQDPNAPSTGGAPPSEEAGSQALGEALRSSFFIVQIIMVALVLVFIGSGFFTVKPQEQAIVLRLGKPVDGGRLFNPGPHWAWPPPIDEVVKLRITSLTNAESSVGWYQTPAERAKGAPEPPGMPKLNPANITYALTADTNIIHVRAIAQYRITDPTVFHFQFADATVFITNALNNALLLASSEFPVDGILTSNRAAFRERVQERVRELVETEKLGVTVDQVDVASSAPLYLLAKFNEVDQAMVKRGNMLNQAQTYATTNVARALGEADTRVKVADAARKRKVDMMAAQADTFTKLLAQYERDPELFKRIRQMAVLESVYTNALDKIAVPPNSHELRFQLSREPQEPSVSNIPTQP
jgi:membrane protease subunit HflK